MDVFKSPELLSGISWGAVALAVMVAIGRRRRPAPIAGAAVAGAWLGGIAAVRPISLSTGAGIALLVVPGILERRLRVRRPLAAIVALLGAWLVARDLPGARWVVVLGMATIAVSGPVIARFVEASPSVLPVSMFAMTVAGMYATLPDTEEVVVLLGATALPALAVWPFRMARMGSFGAYVLPAVLMWTAAWGGRGREGAIVGAVASLGMLVLAPLGTRTIADRPSRVIALVGIHALVVTVTARVAGLQTDALPAAAIAAGVWTAGALVWKLTARITVPSTGR